MPLSIGTRTRQLKVESASSNDSRRMQGSYRPADGSVVRNTDISFGSGNTITSGSSEFGNIVAGQVISISGSPGNSREYLVATASASELTVLPAILATESSGAEIFVRKV